MQTLPHGSRSDFLWKWRHFQHPNATSWLFTARGARPMSEQTVVLTNPVSLDHEQGFQTQQWEIFHGCLLGCYLHHQGNNRPDDGVSKHIRNICKLLRDYKAQQSRRQPCYSMFLNKLQEALRKIFTPSWFSSSLHKTIFLIPPIQHLELISGAADM